MESLKKEILDIYRSHHRGKENAITRADFIAKYERFGFVPFLFLSDRQFRQIYSEIPICTCEKGGFYPIRKAELLEYRDYLRKKAIPLFGRFNLVCDAHPELADDVGQMNLYGEPGGLK